MRLVYYCPSNTRDFFSSNYYICEIETKNFKPREILHSFKEFWISDKRTLINVLVTKIVIILIYNL